MKQITSYIIEGLRINKNIKLKNIFIEEILDFLFDKPEDASNEEVKIFTDWVKHNKVEHMTIICSEKELKTYNPTEDIKDIINKYNNNDNVDLLFQDDTFIMLGELKYHNKENNFYIFINEAGWMCYSTKDICQFYFIPRKMSKKEASKYTYN